MPLYTGKAINASGQEVDFTREADSRERLTLELKAKGLFPVRVRILPRGSQRRRISSRAILDFTETLGLLLSSGLSLKDALVIMLTIFRRGAVNELATELIGKIEKGSSFYQALEPFESSLPAVYRGLVKIGEKIGGLESILRRLFSHLSDKKKFGEKILNALTYPLIVLGVAIVGIGLLGFFILPKVEEMYIQIGLGLPEEMSLRMNTLGNLFILLGVALGCLLLFFLVGAWLRRRSAAFVTQWDRWILKIPLLGRIFLYRDSLSFLFAMETLTESGFAVEDALGEAVYALDNLALRRGIRAVEAKIRRGRFLSQALLEDPLFPERIGQWLVIGERSGNVERVFHQLRLYYQEEIDRWTSRITTLAEPLFMIVVGILIVIFLFIFILPIFSIYQELI